MSTNVFPLTFQSHVIFCIIAAAFFIFQYIRTKSLYQLLTVFAILGTLVLYVSDSKAVFNGIGIFELVMLAAIGISSAMTRKKKPEAETAAEAENPADLQEKEVTENENGNS